jgi:ATP-dependent helicase/nuclease subunit A
MTDSQQRAIYTHDRNLIVVAGAGSGKTYTLVNRYLALLDAHPDWPLNGLVAITFTRKAAQEMRDRVRRELETRYETATDPAQREAWGRRLRSMDSARIDTIHGLCTDILRANAAEAGVDPQFDVLDETQAAQLRDDALDSLLETLTAPVAQVFAIVNEQAVKDALKALIAADLRPLPTDLLADWEQRATAHLNTLVQAALFQDAYAYRNDSPPGANDDKLLAHFKAITPFMDRIQDASAPFSDRLRALVAFHASQKAGNIGSRSFWGDDPKVIRKPLQDLREALADWVQWIGDPVIEQRSAELLPLWHELLTQAQAAYRQAKDSAGVLDFDDLERLTRNLLRAHPAVGARYRGAAFRHLLVDEFQDTNADQWAIIQALIDLEAPGSLFVVGDPKQSIYQFRGADVSVFEQVRGQILAAGGESLDLARSFRTHAPLVAAFNHLFGAVLVKEPGGLAPEFEVAYGTPMEAARPEPPSTAPPLEVVLLEKTALPSDEDEAARRWEADAVARRLRALVKEEARPVFDRHLNATRPMRYGDIALLFQSTTHLPLYEAALKAHGLPYLTVAGRGYFNRQEVRDVINLLGALYNPADDLALAAALRAPLFNLSDEELLRLRLMRNAEGERLPLWEALQSPAQTSEAIDSAAHILADLRAMAGRVTIADLLGTALDQTGYRATLTALPDGDRLRGNIDKLLDRARASGQITLGAFEAYLNDLSASEAREGEAVIEAGDAISLMTVHASKGLEFPLVVLVDSNWERGKGGSSPPVIQDAHLGLACQVPDTTDESLTPSSAYALIKARREAQAEAERKRLLYVAATRAQDYLLISAALNRKKQGDWEVKGWLKLLWGPLGLEDAEFAEDETVSLAQGWGPLPVTLLTKPSQAVDPTEITTQWDRDTIQRGQPLDGIPPAAPPLAQPVRIARASIARHLTATQIAQAGAARYDARQGDQFRRDVLRAAPWRVETVVGQRENDVPMRIIGEMVHRVLKFAHLQETDDALNRILKSYAWELGVVEPGKQQSAMQEARLLLRRSRGDAIHQQVAGAAQVYRELPFVFRAEGRIIHGVLDVLFQRADGTWNVLDYKTNSLVSSGRKPSLDDLALHARRFHLQVGVYAAAVQAQLDGIVPDVYIHYIRYGQTVPIPTDQWRSALAGLDESIGGLLSEPDWTA